MMMKKIDKKGTQKLIEPFFVLYDHDQCNITNYHLINDLINNII